MPWRLLWWVSSVAFTIAILVREGVLLIWLAVLGIPIGGAALVRYLFPRLPPRLQNVLVLAGLALLSVGVLAIIVYGVLGVVGIIDVDWAIDEREGWAPRDVLW